MGPVSVYLGKEAKFLLWKLIKSMSSLSKMVNQSTELIWLIHKHPKTTEHNGSVWAEFSTVEHGLIIIPHSA